MNKCLWRHTRENLAISKVINILQRVESNEKRYSPFTGFFGKRADGVYLVIWHKVEFFFLHKYSQFVNLLLIKTRPQSIYNIYHSRHAIRIVRSYYYQLPINCMRLRCCAFMWSIRKSSANVVKHIQRNKIFNHFQKQNFQK